MPAPEIGQWPTVSGGSWRATCLCRCAKPSTVSSLMLLERTVASEADTERVGAALATAMDGGSAGGGAVPTGANAGAVFPPPRLHAGLVLFLHGELGAGKTTLVRGILRGLGYTGAELAMQE